ncbi:MAG: iron ABC transporter permease [Bacteroidaceae bacterium]|nr:iron ABC transporter permease [Bacteroidaceae bacterium]
MRQHAAIILLTACAVLLVAANLLWGSLDIPLESVLRILSGESESQNPAWRFIVLESRIPQALTALLCGASLSTCGLMLQTLFRNPLAGPGILGIDAGANLGVALVMLLLGGSLGLGGLSLGGYVLVVAAAMVGATAIMLLLLVLSHTLRSATMLLITGVVVSYVTGSVISLLNYSATEEGVHNFIIWGMGNFGSVSLAHLPLYAALLLAGLVAAVLLAKPLNALLLGERYATNLGINVRRTRGFLLCCTGLLTATTTAFCGPISFLGLAVPHIARMLLRTSDHRVLLPGAMLTGGCLTLACNLLCTQLRQGSVLPINVVTPLIGAPVILYVILKQNKYT